MSALQFTCRTNDGIVIKEPNSTSHVYAYQHPHVKVFTYSPGCGTLLAYCNPTSVIIVNPTTGQVIQTIQRDNVIDIEFSSQATYISTWERPTKDPETGAMGKNLYVYSVETGQVIASFCHKQQSSWRVQWTQDECLFSRAMPNEVQFWDVKAMGKEPAYRLRLDGLSDFAVSPCKREPYYVAVFVPERKGLPGSVRIYNIFDTTSPVSQKTFFKADKVQFFWNNAGTTVLALAQTEVDQTGQSYYGETNLYYLSAQGGFDSHVQLDKDGPIQDVIWRPNGKEFLVIYGYTPARAKLFDNKCQVRFDFGARPRNTAKFNPQGDLLCMAGFGNLAGDMDFWHLPNDQNVPAGQLKFKRLSTAHASGATMYEWSPCGRRLLTATLSPRLRVDNGYTIWHYAQGTMVAKEGFKELFQVKFRPASPSTSAQPRALSPPPPIPEHLRSSMDATTKDKSIAKPTGVYRPPGARGRANHSSYKREEELATEQREAAEKKPMSKTSLKNKKKREAAKQKHAAIQVPGSDTGSLYGSGDSTPVATRPVLTPTEKKILNLERKLKAIEALRVAFAAGEELQLNQIEKMNKEQSIRDQIEALRLA